MHRFLFLSTILGFLFSACYQRETIRGNGNITSESRNVGGFKELELQGGMNVHLKKGEEEAIDVEGEENILPYVETFLRDEKLIIKYKDHYNINARKPVTVSVTASRMEDIRITGSGDITGEDRFSSNDEIEVGVTGSGNIKLELDAPAIEAKITGSGDIYLSGNTRDIKCSTTGSGKIDATELKAENANVRSTGSGNISVFASVRLDATVNGSGDIRYKGGATVSSKTNGSGSVRSID